MTLIYLRVANFEDYNPLVFVIIIAFLHSKNNHHNLLRHFLVRGWISATTRRKMNFKALRLESRENQAY
jgi:hypothetical protein